MKELPPEALSLVAAYFQVLAEPTRLRILNALREGERNVGELAQTCGYTAANISRHLSLMTKHAIVAREVRGTSVYYRIADPSVYQLCDLVCGNLARQYERAASDRALFVDGTARAAPSPSPARRPKAAPGAVTMQERKAR